MRWKDVLADIQNNTQAVLRLADWKINDQGVLTLAKALEKNHSLFAINLSSNQISDEGAKALITALKHNRTMTWMQLANNPISESLQAEISGLLTRNQNGLIQLFSGAQQGDVVSVNKQLSQGIYPYVEDGHGDTILHIAARNNDVTLLNYFVSQHFNFKIYNASKEQPFPLMSETTQKIVNRSLLEERIRQNLADGIALDRQGKIVGAIKKYSDVIRSSEKLGKMHLEALKRRGDAYADRKQYVEAIGDYDKLIESDVFNIDAYQARAVVKEKCEDDYGAFLDYETILRVSKTSNSTSIQTEIDRLRKKAAAQCRTEGKRFAAQKDFKKAIRAYTDALRVDPRDVYSLRHRGAARLRAFRRNVHLQVAAGSSHNDDGSQQQRFTVENDPNNALQLARQDCDTALRYHSCYVRAYLLRAEIKAELQDYEGAIQDNAHALQLDPNLQSKQMPVIEKLKNQHAMQLLAQGIQEFESGHTEVALFQLKKAQELDNHLAAAWFYIGRVHAELGDNEEAIVAYNQAIHDDAHQADYFLKRGLAYHHLNQISEALNDYQQAVFLNADLQVMLQPDIDALQAQVLERELNDQQYDCAIQQCNHLLQENHNYEPALQTLRLINDSLGQQVVLSERSQLALKIWLTFVPSMQRLLEGLHIPFAIHNHEGVVSIASTDVLFLSVFHRFLHININLDHIATIHIQEKEESYIRIPLYGLNTSYVDSMMMALLQVEESVFLLALMQYLKAINIALTPAKHYSAHPKRIVHFVTTTFRNIVRYADQSFAYFHRAVQQYQAGFDQYLNVLNLFWTETVLYNNMRHCVQQALDTTQRLQSDEENFQNARKHYDRVLASWRKANQKFRAQCDLLSHDLLDAFQKLFMQEEQQLNRLLYPLSQTKKLLDESGAVSQRESRDQKILLQQEKAKNLFEKQSKALHLFEENWQQQWESKTKRHASSQQVSWHELQQHLCAIDYLWFQHEFFMPAFYDAIERAFSSTLLHRVTSFSSESLAEISQTVCLKLKNAHILESLGDATERTRWRRHISFWIQHCLQPLGADDQTICFEWKWNELLGQDNVTWRKILESLYGDRQAGIYPTLEIAPSTIDVQRYEGPICWYALLLGNKKHLLDCNILPFLLAFFPLEQVPSNTLIWQFIRDHKANDVSTSSSPQLFQPTDSTRSVASRQQIWCRFFGVETMHEEGVEAAVKQSDVGTEENIVAPELVDYVLL